MKTARASQASERPPEPATELARLQRKWYRRLKADGFRDLEGGVDQQIAVRELPPDIEQRAASMFWSRAQEWAVRLPRDYPRRRFLLLATAIANVRRAARETGLSKKASWWAFRRFLLLADLPAPKVKGPSHGRGRPNRDEER